MTTAGPDQGSAVVVVRAMFGTPATSGDRGLISPTCGSTGAAACAVLEEQARCRRCSTRSPCGG
ncbi:hypothetical protein ACFPM0_12140 [Pseudonocardia sulfidoxydans]|uniref:hypothetical protein n=1 Tax=Pseudonocardia sulfidoxydans TaxID=54011 RepID=UPI00361CB41B